MRGLYFVEHSLGTSQAKGLYQALQESLCPIGLQMYETKANAGTSTSLMEACKKTYLSSVGIFDLSAPRADTYLQIGISVGLSKPALIIAGQGMTAGIPPILNRSRVWFYTPPLTAGKELQRAVLRPVDKWATFERNASGTQGEDAQTYCAFCGSPCKGGRRQTHGKGYLLLDGTHARSNELRSSIKHSLEPTGLIPIYLSQLKGRVMPLLCELRLAVLAAEFVVLDLSVPCDAEQYIALGMAVSMRRPWLLTTSQLEGLPYLLQEAGRLEYARDEELRERLEQYVIQSLYPTRFAATRGATARLEFPFWRQLEDWIARFEVHTSRAMEGALQLLLIEEGQLKQRCRMTPNTLMTAGRDPECDLVIEAQGASRFHADFIFDGQNLLVIDRESTNGTFVNGSRIASQQQVSLEIGDRIRIGPAEVVVWNEVELPEEVKEYLPESGRIVPQTIFVNLADGLVLANGKIPVASLTASEINLLAFMREKGEKTTTSSEVAEIVYGTGQVSRMIVASFVDGLRAKIEPSPSKPRFLVAVPGTGYRLRTRGGQLILSERVPSR
jgi:pSer/pThr/pTyr-binding forkhead associated (FHA) protein